MVYTVFYKTSSFAKCCFVVKTVYTIKEPMSYFIENILVFGKISNLLIYSFKYTYSSFSFAYVFVEFSSFANIIYS